MGRGLAEEIATSFAPQNHNMAKQINPANRIIGKICPADGTRERYRASGKCCACKARSQQEWNSGRIHNNERPQGIVPKRRIAAKPQKPMPHPHVIESDFIRPPTKAQLMGRK